MLLLVAAFFALCIAYVAWCDRIIGSDPAESGAAAMSDISTNDIAGQAGQDVSEDLRVS
jgi:hypothetical protein